MATIQTYTVTSSGTAVDFYTELKNVLVDAGLDYNSELSSDRKLIFDIDDGLWLSFEDYNQTEDATNNNIKMAFYRGDVSSQVSAINHAYMSGSVLPTVSSTRTIKLYVVNNGDIYLNCTGYNITAPTSANTIIATVTKPDGNNVKGILYLGNDNIYLPEGNGTMLYKHLATMYTDTDNIVTDNPIIQYANKCYGTCSNVLLSSVGELNTKYVLDGKEYISVCRNANTKYCILVPYN